MSILGNRVVRREDVSFLTTGGTYVGDLQPAGAVHLVYVRSIMAHARITAVDIDEAKAAPPAWSGCSRPPISPLSATTVGPRTCYPSSPRPWNGRSWPPTWLVMWASRSWPLLAETREQAADAAELVFVDYEPLTPVLDPEATLAAADAGAEEALLFPEHGTNIVNRLRSESPADFDGCEVVVSERIVNQRLTGAPIEPRTGAAWWTDDGRLVHYSACQGAHPTRDVLAAIYGLDKSQVRVVVPDVGGGFGVKSRTYPEEQALGFYARALGRPVLWTETRSENVAAMPQGRGQIQYAKLGGTRDGRITAYQLDVVADIGAYPIIGAVLPGNTQRMLCGTYDITNVGFTGAIVATNKVSTTAYRGAGRPEATVAIERMIDRYAAEIGMDPAEVRFKNLIPRFTEPYVTGIGTTYDVGDYPEALRLALDAAGYDELRAEQRRRREAGDQKLLGVGVASYVEITAGGPGGEYGAVELTVDGRVTVTTGSTPYGQGHETTWAMLVADRTGIPMDRIDVIHGDTDQVPRGGLTVGSRSVQIGGSALAAATTSLIDVAREQAARLLEAPVDDVVLDRDTGGFHVVGTPAVSVAWDTVAAEADGPVAGEHDFTAPQPTFPCGAHVAVVEVDADTGATTLQRIVAVDDAGTILNPLLAEGQVHGGLAQGIAQALLEEIVYDADGNLVTSNFLDYSVISAAELPSFEAIHLETPTWVNELGAKGVGESGTIGSIPAVYNAVIDAVAHLGVRHLETPLTPEKVWRALVSSRAD